MENKKQEKAEEGVKFTPAKKGHTGAGLRTADLRFDHHDNLPAVERA